MFEVIGIIAVYLAAYIGGGFVATVLFSWWLNSTRWARTAEIAFFIPVIFFAGAWAIVGAGIGLFLLGAWIL